MSSDVTSDDVNEPDQIKFVQYHQPGLRDGDYEIAVEQQIYTHEAGQKKISTGFTAGKKFSVAGERFVLNPSDIYAVFPPAGSLGEHSNVLPHVILQRSTLPWERSADETRRDIPWLALLLFDDDEPVTPKILSLGELTKRSDSSLKWPGLTLETWQHADDKVTVIDVEESLLKKILPAASELAWLAHVRQGTDVGGKAAGDERAVIIGKRLPAKGKISTVHLVSVEDRYPNGVFDFQSAKAGDLIRLVSLKSWSFACVDKKQDFNGLLTNLDRRPGTLRLPQEESPEAEKYLSMGYVPLPHDLRQGGKTVSWYHGPLLPGENLSGVASPASASDELLRYNPADGMFDVSYAAAWELGRLLALQNKHLSLSLYNWKRSHVQQLKQAEQFLSFPHPLPGQPPAALTIPKDITSWFESLGLLQGVPFNYLVPDERMLPKESIRFVWLDQLWVECLLDGAFSIGRVTTADHLHDKNLDKKPAANAYENVSGLLLRSEVVSGWPGLLVDAYDQVKGGKQLKLRRMERLSANILLCLFEGEVKRAEIHQQPESLHFGLDVHKQDPFGFHKTFRKGNGDPVPVELGADSDLWQEEPQRILNITRLAQTSNVESSATFTSAQFALQMIEGVEKTIFECITSK